LLAAAKINPGLRFASLNSYRRNELLSVSLSSGLVSLNRKEIFMKKSKLFAVTIFAVILMVSLGLGLSLQAQESKESKSHDPRVLAGAARVAMLEAVLTATKEAPGVVTNAELEKEKSQLIYSFDILPSAQSQKITEIHIDALTGKVLSKEEEKLSGGEEEEQEEKADKEAKVAATTKESKEAGKAKEAKAVKETEEEKEEAAGEEKEQNLSELVPAVKISLAQAIKTALADSPGFVLSAELEKENGKIIYSFDILPSPQAREINEIQVDVTTGQIVAREKEEIK